MTLLSALIAATATATSPLPSERWKTSTTTTLKEMHAVRRLTCALHWRGDALLSESCASCRLCSMLFVTLNAGESKRKCCHKLQRVASCCRTSLQRKLRSVCRTRWTLRASPGRNPRSAVRLTWTAMRCSRCACLNAQDVRLHKLRVGTHWPPPRSGRLVCSG